MSLQPLRNLTFGVVLLICLVAGSVAPAAGQPRPESWRVAFDDSGEEFQRALLGTLELADGVLTFRADNRSIRWSLALADVRQIAASRNYGQDANAVLIESLSGERLYVAVLDKHMFFGSPKRAIKALEAALKLPSTRAARAARTAGDGDSRTGGGD